MKLTVPMALAGVAIVYGSALAGTLVGPRYVGARSVDAERATYAYVPSAGSRQTLGFVGPAGYFGAMTGNPEKDTFAYQPLLVAAASDHTALPRPKLASQ